MNLIDQKYIDDESLYTICDTNECKVIDRWHNRNGLVQTVQFADGRVADVYPPLADSHDAVIVFDDGDIGLVSVPI